MTKVQTAIKDSVIPNNETDAATDTTQFLNTQGTSPIIVNSQQQHAVLDDGHPHSQLGLFFTSLAGTINFGELANN